MYKCRPEDDVRLVWKRPGEGKCPNIISSISCTQFRSHTHAHRPPPAPAVCV